jgi:extracellular matrix regulatory protein A
MNKDGITMNFVDVGFSNYVEAKKVLGVSRPDSSPIRRMIQKYKDEGKFIDFTQGKKTRSIIISSCGDDIVLTASAVQTATVVDRIRKAQNIQVKEHVSEEIVQTTIS